MAELDMKQCAKVFKSRGLGVQSFIAFCEDAGFDYMDDTDNGERVTQEQLDEWLNS
jgi:hypothetical protein